MERLESWVRGGCWVLPKGKRAEVRERGDRVLLSVTYTLVLCDNSREKAVNRTNPNPHRLHKIWCFSIMEYYSAPKSNELLVYTTT